MTLNKLLANIAVLNQKAYNMHWNVRGKGFMQTHKLTEALYEGLTELFDEVAEKVAMCGEIPFSTFKEYLDNSDIQEEASRHFTQEEVMVICEKDLSTLLDVAIKVEGTPTTQMVIDEVIQFADKQKWFFTSSK